MSRNSRASHSGSSTSPTLGLHAAASAQFAESLWKGFSGGSIASHLKVATIEPTKPKPRASFGQTSGAHR